jgi:tetratricopeptide (TPR) repeat protein
MAAFMQTIGRFEDAIACNKRALEINPMSTLTLTNMGTCYDATRQVKEGLRCFDRSIAIDPKYVSAYFNKSLNLISQGKYEEGLPLNRYRFDQTPTKGNWLEALSIPSSATDQVMERKFSCTPSSD